MTHRTVVGVMALLLVVGAMPGVAAAQARAGSSVDVAHSEVVEGDVRAVGGSVVVHGQVQGDLTVIGGDVLVTGQVGGDVRAVGGSVEIDGSVGQDVRALGGSVEMGDGAVVSGNVHASGGNVTLAGAVQGDVRASGDRIQFREGLSIGGDFAYRGTDSVRGPEPMIRGEIVSMNALDAHYAATLFAVPGPLVPLFGIVATLFGGVVLTVAAPRFSLRVIGNVARDPKRATIAGAAVAVAVPVALVVLAITLVGVPLSLAGAFAFLALAWVGSIYGRFALGAWLLSRFDAEERWRSLVVGVVLVGAAGLLPVVGTLLEVGVLLVGLGAVSLELDRRFDAAAVGERFRRQLRGLVGN